MFVRVIRAFFNIVMAVVDSIILVIIGAGALVGFYKRFCKAVGYLVGTGCRSGGGKGFVCFRCRESVFQDYRFNDSGASAGIHCYLGSGASGFCVDSFAADEGDGSRVARLAEPVGWVPGWER